MPGLNTANLKKLFKSHDKFKMFTAEQKKKYLDEYGPSIENDASLSGTGAFENYQKKRAKNATTFAGIKLPDDTTLGDKLKDSSPDVDAVKEAIAEVLQTSEATTQANDKFKQEMEAVSRLLTQEPREFNAQAIASYLQGVKGEADAAIKAQHKQELENLENKFNDPTFINHLKAGTGLDDEQVSDLHEEMKKALEKKQQETLAAFNKEVNKDITALHEESRKEIERITYLAGIYENEKNRAAIDELAKKNQSQEPTTAQIGIDSNGSATLKGIKVTDLPVIYSFTGRTIKPQNDGSFAIQFPKWNLLYYRNHNMVYDMTNMAAAVRASGHDSITMSVNHKGQKGADGKMDEKYVMEMGRNAYEGALKAGFPPDKISIEVNGRVVKKEELFAEKPDRLQVITERAERGRAKYDALIKRTEKVSENTTRSLKEQITALRNAANTPAPEPDANPPALGA
ncbi:hypothetical protein [Legionella spiritensis]|uniref:Coiled coil domain-containing protein n=2 Tax=Legionella spiritensis TaxID=452 RepID=A0A0W0YX44_LEGSP|nr:hypothetical protein [Legionella spiritensis]KTD61426.1 coiled coil domain-containing protein [Legionella spiritensis]SNV33351.1 coiled coil domain protein [Legionella spiritensis]